MSESNESITSGGLAQLHPWPESKENLIKNPSFEEISETTGKPVGWSLGQAAFWTSAPEARDGQRSLLLTDANLSKFTPLATQNVSITPGYYTVRGYMKTEGVTGGSGRIDVDGGGSTDFASGTRDWTLYQQADMKLESPTTRVIMNAFSKPAGKVWFDAIKLHRLRPPLADMFLLYPSYRGYLWTDRDQSVRVRVTVRPEEAGMSLSDMRVRLILERQDGTPVSSCEVTPTAYTFDLAVDASNAPEGELRARLQVYHADTNYYYEYPHYMIRKLAPTVRASFRTYIDTDHHLVLDGVKRFPLGIYDTSGYGFEGFWRDRISKIAEAPFNLYINYHLNLMPVPQFNALLNVLGEYGMKYLHTVNSLHESNTSEWPYRFPAIEGQRPEDLGLAAYTAARARVHGAHPNLAGWYTMDERPASLAQRTFDQYAILRAHDPDGITFAATNKPKEAERWRDVVDVMAPDSYPVRVDRDKGLPQPLHEIVTWMDKCRAATCDARPTWAVIQFFGLFAGAGWPTEEELRQMSWLALTSGAKGLFYWSYGAGALAYVKDLAVREALWQRLVRVTSEIKSHEAALLAPETPVLVPSDVAPIRMLQRVVGGVRYVFASHTTGTTVTRTFTPSDEFTAVEVLNEGRVIPASNGQFTDEFGPYAVHLYKLV